MNTKRFLLLLVFTFISSVSYAQKIEAQTICSGTGSANGGTYTYEANLKASSTLPGLDDVMYNLALNNYKITSFVYKGINASSVEGVNFPIYINQQADVKFSLEYYSGNLRANFANLKMLAVKQGYGDYGYLSSSQVAILKNRFEIKTKDDFYRLNLKIHNCEVSNSYLEKLSKVRSLIDAKIQNDKKQEQQEENEQKISDLKIENAKQDDLSENEDENSIVQQENEKKRLKEEEKKKQAAEEERRKKEKSDEYKRRRESQQRINNTSAGIYAAESALLLYLLGGFIYSDMNSPVRSDILFTGNNFFANFDVGYGFSFFPMSNNSVEEGIDYIGNSYRRENNDPISAATLDLRMALKFGWESEIVGGNIYGRFEPGFLPIFTQFNTSYGYGLESFVGIKNVKLYSRYEQGSHNYLSNNWINVEQVGEGGKTVTKYEQIRAGLKFSFFSNYTTAKRDHIIIGIMENYFDENSASIFSTRETLGEPRFNIIERDPKYLATGYFFEWKRDHSHRLYIEIFPNYPVTGEIGRTSDEGKMFIQVGFIRSFTGFAPSLR